MGLCISVIEPGRWGGGKRMPKCVEYLTRYGTHAKAVLPALQEMRRAAAGSKRGGGEDEQLAALDSAIAKITASMTTPTLVDAKDFKPRK